LGKVWEGDLYNENENEYAYGIRPY